MEMRMITPKYLEQVMDLWDYCFEKREEPFFKWYFTEYCLKNNLVIGGFEEINDRLLNMLHLNPYNVMLRGRKEAMPYIVGVATAPEARGRHLTAGLLVTAFKVLRNEQFAFALLMPINAGIYLPYEFAFTYYKHAYDLPLEKLTLPAPRRDVRLERVSSLKPEYFAECYEAYGRDHEGMVVRNDFQWSKLLTVHSLEGVQGVVARIDNKICGYMLYRVSNERFTALELIAPDNDAKLALLAYAKGHLSVAKDFYWEAGAEDLTYLSLKEAQYSGSTKPFMMARCIDAARALAALQVPQNMPEGSCNLILTDELLPLNNHLFKLQVRQGVLTTVMTAEDEDIVMDMAAFTQLYFGTFTATELAAAGRLKVFNPAKLAFLDTLLPKQNNFINEYF